MKILKFFVMLLILGSLLLLLIKDIVITKQLFYPINNLTHQSKNQTYISNPNATTIDSINAKLYCELAERNFKASNGVFSSIQWTYTFTGALITLFITLFGFLGWKFVIPMLLNKQIKDWADSSTEFKKIKTDILENSREMNIALAILYRNDGLSRWEQKVNDRAIELTEKALIFFKKACTEAKPRSKDDQILWGTICGNLSYYYAESGNHAKYDEALKYARISLTIGKKYHVMHLVENFPYVVKQYAVKDPLIKKEAKEILNAYKGDLLSAGILKPKDIEEYESYLSK
ncbi:MAG: hypothetical protein WC317_02120 [Candidatus Omnitrophota bacterium]|jgi:hypothetical protein